MNTVCTVTLFFYQFFIYTFSDICVIRLFSEVGHLSLTHVLFIGPSENSVSALASPMFRERGLQDDTHSPVALKFDPSVLRASRGDWDGRGTGECGPYSHFRCNGWLLIYIPLHIRAKMSWCANAIALTICRTPVVLQNTSCAPCGRGFSKFKGPISRLVLNSFFFDHLI